MLSHMGGILSPIPAIVFLIASNRYHLSMAYVFALARDQDLLKVFAVVRQLRATYRAFL